MTLLTLAAVAYFLHLAAVLLGRWIAPEVRVERICPDCKETHE